VLLNAFLVFFLSTAHNLIIPQLDGRRWLMWSSNIDHLRTLSSRYSEFVQSRLFLGRIYPNNIDKLANKVKCIAQHLLHIIDHQFQKHTCIIYQKLNANNPAGFFYKSYQRYLFVIYRHIGPRPRIWGGAKKKRRRRRRKKHRSWGVPYFSAPRRIF